MGLISKFISEKIDIMAIAFILFISSFLCVIVPESWFDIIGVKDFLITHKLWFRLCLCFSGFILLSLGLLKLIKCEYYWQYKIRLKRAIKQLTASEKKILNKYIKNNTQTQTLDLNNGVVAGLVQKEIIYQSTRISHPAFQKVLFDFNISPWIYFWLMKHREYLK